MLRPRIGTCSLVLALVAAVAIVATIPSSAAAQQSVQHATSTGSPVSTDSIAVFARTHLAVSALRDQYQAQFAEPQNKKREVQDALHEKFREALNALLKEHGYSEGEYARLTRLVSVDSTARRAFEEALQREGEEVVALGADVP